MLATLIDQLAASRTARRRSRNLRAGARPASAEAGRSLSIGSAWLWAVLVVVLGGAVALAMHARALPDGAAETPGAVALGALQPLAPGLDFVVPRESGVSLTQHGGLALLVASGMRAGPALRVDLCTQMLDPARPRMLPLRIGYPFDEAARIAGAADAPPRSVLLARSGSTMPRIDIAGNAGAGATGLTLAWNAGAATAGWIGDASGGNVTRARQGQAVLGNSGWLLWGSEALRFTRRPSAACPQAGELVLHHYQLGAAGGAALVQAFPAHGASVELRLAPGAWQVPLRPGPGMEDQALFEALRARGLLRQGRDGLVELAPRDLLAWQQAGQEARAPLPGWEDHVLDVGGRRLLERLHHRADGAYVREQVRIFNSERRLVAWRTRPGADAVWHALVGGAPAPREAGLPVAAMRLFARLPEGWEPWQRVGGWEGGRQGSLVTLNTPATGRPVELLVAGRVRGVIGARVLAQGACDGRACPDREAVQRLVLAPLAGAAAIAVQVEPLDLAAMSGSADAAYRHLAMVDGRLAWQALPAGGSGGTRPAAVPVRLRDRDGEALWADGAPAGAALGAGLAPLLGVHRQHDGSVAGMLARLGGAGHEAQLSLDLDLQARAQQLLDCIGLRGGRWDGQACVGGLDAQPERRAGLVLLDAGSGDILAAASSGGGQADPSRWAELRDFDRADPARSPLRSAAFQHDGGAHRAPGSTFKVITALGLEGAARADARLDGLLQGLSLHEVDRLAQAGGYDFRTGAPSYPFDGNRARITNFRDQITSTRAQDGRLGLAQAMAHSVNTWFAWSAELSDRTLMGQPDGGMPGARELEPGALDTVRPVAAMAARLGFGQPLRLDGGLLPPDYRWGEWDALQASASRLDPVHSRHELRQMAIGLRMQATPLQMALVAAAVGEGRTVAPRLLLSLDGRAAQATPGQALGVRLDRVRAGMKGVIDGGTAAGAFRGAGFDLLRPGLYGKTGTAPAGQDELATVWFMGWLEPGSLPGQAGRLAFAAFVSHSAATGGGHAAPVVAALLQSMQSSTESSTKRQSLEKRHK
ncbi:penicillin-binding transpeptidase domain-containing protein [Massilia timonae]|uniref:penicillin-binding transpeptidase domain-containing protein n=1 Tax=Massilia timonae TaxID=47229 RepID=UPI0028998A5E|nr:penicillin-binding transpeptidase domain-containing protein [Massilia timonae]